MIVEPSVESVLQQVGSQLDQEIFPAVRNGGIVTPTEAAVPSNLGAEKYDDEQKEQRRSATRSRKRAARRERSAGRSGSTRETSSHVSTSLQALYEDALDAVQRAYPTTEIWKRKDGLWLLTRSSLLPGLPRAAVFLTGISYRKALVRAWGFWKCSLIGETWIGPRHTNFPDGSVCAFHPTDGTWVVGDPIVELLDLYTLWALRHLYLEAFGRWPGRQAVFHPYERIVELRGDEYCGCGRSGRLYCECCRDKDLGRNRIAIAVDFLSRFAGGLRKPPRAIVQSVRDQSQPPRFSDVFL